MKVLQVIQKPQLRGAEIFACQLSQELMRKGVYVDILCLFTNDNYGKDFNYEYIALGANQQNRLFDLSGFRKLSKIINDGGYDVVQANSGDTLKYTVLSRMFFNWKAKLVFRNANRMTGFMRSFVHRTFNRWLLSKSDYFISVSENSRQDLISFYPPAKQRSATIPIGCYASDQVAPAFDDEIKGGPVLISVGSFVPEKNHTFLIDVFTQYYKRSGRGNLWLVGDGRLRPMLESQVQDAGIAERVKFWGYRNDVSSLLKSADVFVLPSLIEGLPAVILEAIVCDLPVVASAVGGVPELIRNNETGVCIGNHNVENYVESISMILSDDALRNRLVQNAKVRVLNEFTLDKISDRFLSQYEQLIRH